MNKYIIPVYNVDYDKVVIKTYWARSLHECQEKIMNEHDCYDLEWDEFVNEMYEEYRFGKIIDTEEL